MPSGGFADNYRVGADMEINIEDEEVCALIDELALLLGVDAEEAVAIAVRNRLERIKSGQDDPKGESSK